MLAQKKRPNDWMVFNGQPDAGLLASGPDHRKHNENVKRTVKENAKRTMNENAKKQ